MSAFIKATFGVGGRAKRLGMKITNVTVNGEPIDKLGDAIPVTVWKDTISAEDVITIDVSKIGEKQ